MKLLQKIIAWFRRLFQKGRDLLPQAVEQAIRWVEIVKQAIDNDTLDVLVGLTQTNVDNAALSGLRYVLSKALQWLYDLKKVPDRLETYQLLTRIKAEPPAKRNALYLKLATGLAYNTLLDKGKVVSESEIDTTVQLIYSTNKPA